MVRPVHLLRAKQEIAEAQVVAAFGTAAFTRPAGYVSLMATPLMAVVALGLVMVRVSVVLLLSAVATGENALATVGAVRTRVCAVAGT